MSDEHETETVSVKGALPVSMVLGALWLITMTLAGWWATDLRTQVQDVAAYHRIQSETLATVQERVKQLEAATPTKADSREMSEVLRRLARVEEKLDDLRERAPATRK